MDGPKNHVVELNLQLKVHNLKCILKWDLVTVFEMTLKVGLNGRVSRNSIDLQSQETKTCFTTKSGSYDTVVIVVVDTISFFIKCQNISTICVCVYVCVCLSI